MTTGKFSLYRLWVLSISLLSFTLTACCKSPNGHVNSAYSVMVAHARLQASRKIMLDGMGGAMFDRVNRLSLSYYVEKRATLKESRLLILQLIDELLTIANQSVELRPHLIEYPLKEKHVELGISFLDQNGTYYSLPLVADVFAINGKIFYSGRDETTGLLDLDSFFEETVEEARAILAAEQEASCSQ